MDDKVRAEGIAINDYSALFVDKGTVIHATRDFKALNFKEILEKHHVENTDRYIQPTPSIGGWGKFIKNHITSAKTQPNRKRTEIFRVEENKQRAKTKKSGRGWLHK
jgi:hypothetical protein